MLPNDANRDAIHVQPWHLQLLKKDDDQAFPVILFIRNGPIADGMILAVLFFRYSLSKTGLPLKAGHFWNQYFTRHSRESGNPV